MAISYSTVRDYVAKRRPEILAEAGKPLEAGFVPQTHEPGAEAEVDFHDLWVILRGVKTKTALFTMRLSFSGRAAHRASLSQGQEAFLEGHVDAFARLGGVPLGCPLRQPEGGGVRVLFGRTRAETQRWVGFRSTRLGGFYCQPGEEGTHEKGGVEGEVAGSGAPIWCRCRGWRAHRGTQRADRGRGRRRRRTAGSASGGARRGRLGGRAAAAAPGARGTVRHRADPAPRVDRYAQVMVRSACTRCPPG